MNEWISVDKELPELRNSVLCCVNNQGQLIQICLTREIITDDCQWEWYATFGFKPPEDNRKCFFPQIPKDLVLYWKSLPEFPKWN